jgi:mannose/fructose/N-acetylgalactosamine-specific phosphotransferase system component IIC
VSAFDAAVADMDASLFEVMGDAATVQRGTGAPVPVRVVVARPVAKLGQYGQVVARVTTALFRNSEWQPEQADVLTLSDGARKVASIDAQTMVT